MLERAGLIAAAARRSGARAASRPSALKDVDNWLENYRRFWEASLDRLDDYLREMQAKETKRGRKK